MKVMKRLMVLILGVILMSAAVYAKDNVMTKKAGDYTITASFDRTQQIAGDNTFFITIRDAEGKAITDAAVGVHYYMTEKAGPTGKYVEMASMGADPLCPDLPDWRAPAPPLRPMPRAPLRKTCAVKFSSCNLLVGFASNARW